MRRIIIDIDIEIEEIINKFIDNKTIQNYLNILNETGLIELLSENKSGSNLLRHTEKMIYYIIGAAVII